MVVGCVQERPPCRRYDFNVLDLRKKAWHVCNHISGPTALSLGHGVKSIVVDLVWGF